MITKGNIQEQISAHPENRGWIMGAFLDTANPLHSDNVEIKWVTHRTGDFRQGSVSSYSKKSVDIVLEGKCHFSFPSHTQEFELSQGDYVVYDTALCTHTFEAISDCKLIVIRTPSHPIK